MQQVTESNIGKKEKGTVDKRVPNVISHLLWVLTDYIICCH